MITTDVMREDFKYEDATVRIEIGETCGAEGFGQITFFVSININSFQNCSKKVFRFPIQLI